MMNKIKRPRFYAAIVVATVMLLGSCDMIMDFLGNSPIAEFFGLDTDEDTEERRVGTPVAVNTVSFDNQNILIGIGEKVRLLNPTTPATAWTSAAPEIATVDTNGTVTGVAAGTVEITVNGGSTPPASVVVVPADNVITVTNTDEWNTAFNTISGNGDTNYILKIQGNFDVAGSTSANITTAAKKVRLTGNGTVTLSSQGSIIRTAANQTYIIDGPTLVGKSATDNTDRAVVYVGGGGAELRSGVIRGNTTKGINGGGVYIYSGTFEMNGGTVSGNNAEYGGAGVYVNSGTFKMSGGTISGNEATGTGASGYGGGVRVQNGTFEMSGGTITGNIACGEFGGGGVWVYASGTFQKTGGTIYGEDNPDTITHTGSPANTATYTTNSGKKGHAVALYLDQSVLTLFYRNGTLGPTDDLITAGVTVGSLGAFEGYWQK